MRAGRALLNFGQGHALFFDGEEPLGMVVMGASADSLWSALAKVLVDDPLLRAERPRSSWSRLPRRSPSEGRLLRRLTSRLVPILALVVFSAGIARAAKPPSLPNFGLRPSELRERLAAPDSGDVARACGNLYAPWGYRGQRGQLMAMRIFGRRHIDAERARALAAWLLGYRVIGYTVQEPDARSPCDPETGKPIFLASFHARDRSTFALLDFEHGEALFFDGEEPLGMVAMGADADSIWAALSKALVDDPVLRAPRPLPLPLDTALAEKPPEPFDMPTPVYPADAQRAGIWGDVFIEVRIATDGIVHDAFVIQGDPALREAALDAIWRWRFMPGIRKGNPIEVWVVVPVRFRLH